MVVIPSVSLVNSNQWEQLGFVSKSKFFVNLSEVLLEIWQELSGKMWSEEACRDQKISFLWFRGNVELSVWTVAFLIASLWVFRRHENFSLCLLTSVRRMLVLKQSLLFGEPGGVLLALTELYSHASWTWLGKKGLDAGTSSSTLASTWWFPL